MDMSRIGCTMSFGWTFVEYLNKRNSKGLGQWCLFNNIYFFWLSPMFTFLHKVPKVQSAPGLKWDFSQKRQFIIIIIIIAIKIVWTYP